MKKLLAIIVFAVLAFLAYQTFLAPLSVQEKEIAVFEQDFLEQSKLYTQAMRSAGLTGMNTTLDVQDIIDRIRSIKEDLAEAVDGMDNEKALARGEALLHRISDFLSKNS